MEEAERQRAWEAWQENERLQGYRELEALARKTHEKGLDAYTRQSRITELLDQQLGLKPEGGRRRTWPRAAPLLAQYVSDVEWLADRDVEHPVEEAVAVLDRHFPQRNGRPRRDPYDAIARRIRRAFDEVTRQAARTDLQPSVRENLRDLVDRAARVLPPRRTGWGLR